MLGRGEREVFLAVEVVEEAALGESGGFADVFDAGGGVALGADHVESGVEELFPGDCEFFVMEGHKEAGEFKKLSESSRLEETYQLVGTLSTAIFWLFDWYCLVRLEGRSLFHS